MVTAAELKKIFPSAKAALVAAVVKGWPQAEAAGINTQRRKAMFFAMVGPETGGLTKVEENLNYSAAGLLKTFGRHRISEANAQKLGRKTGQSAKPEEIANLIYGGQWGVANLGNTKPGDGWLYRGGGMMQTTGRANYAKLGFEANPEELRKPNIAFASAVVEWKNRGCNQNADDGDLEGCRRKINGGLNGIAEAKKYYELGLAVFKDQPKPVVKAPSKATVPSKETIKSVQKRLRELNYPEVGNDDGLWGKKTEAAILAFRNDNELELKPGIDEELLAALMASAPRQFSAARATATASDLADSKSISMASTMEKAAGGVIAAGGLGGMGQILELQDQIAKGRAIYDTLVGVAPWALLVVGGGLAIWFGRRFIREQVKAYREGRHV